MNRQAAVFLLDCDKSGTEAIAALLRMEGIPVRTWNSSFEFLDAYDPSAPGCVVAEALMPELNGLQVQREMRLRGCERPVVFVTDHGNIPLSVQCMKAGAVTLLTKPLDRAELLAAILEAFARDAALRADYRERQVIQQRVSTLTPRETEVLKLVTRGLLNKQIAAELGTAEKTVKTHRGRVMHKMRVRSAVELAGLLWRSVG